MIDVIYFPQFTQEDLNDQAWCKDFNDWDLISEANVRNRFLSKRFPKLGKYDTKNLNIIKSQIDSMKQSGIDSIALYHYWFSDHHALNKVENSLLVEDLDFSYYLVWANESWSKRWIGSQEAIIDFNKKPSLHEIQKHVAHLESHMKNKNYKKVDGRPIFFIYNCNNFNDVESVISHYRKEFSKQGLDPIIGCFATAEDTSLKGVFDICYLFEPRAYFTRGGFSKKLNFLRKFGLTESIKVFGVIFDSFKSKFQRNSFTYAEYITYLKERQKDDFYKIMITPGWDNSPRYLDNFTRLEDATAAQFRDAVEIGLEKNDEWPVVINAWNEWSEGCALEDCWFRGNNYLQTLKNLTSCQSNRRI